MDADVSQILDPLNQHQREAVSAPPAHQLVLAGAGSGKTRVLIHRIAWLLQVEQVSPFEVLAVTFTNKAAGEMRGRTESLLGMSATGLWVGTFHGICHRLLRMHWKDAGLPQDFQILDSEDQLRQVKRVLRALELDENRWPPKQAQWFINSKKDEGLRPQHLEDGQDGAHTQLIRVYGEYEAACARAGVVDFAELLLRAHEMLLRDENLLAHYQRRFRHILVDEFQDTNKLQYAWIRVLAGASAKVFVVGDDDQSVYGWRGAKVENIQNFTTHFPDVNTVRLEQNYRSTSTILNAANAVIANNTERLGKNLWTESSDGLPIALYAAHDQDDEARYVVERIRQWSMEGGARREAAILYRSNAQSRVFEQMLGQAGIPYRVYGGLRFFERQEIKDALAYLRLTQNRDDDTSFERVVNRPARGIGAQTLEKLREQARTMGLPLWAAAEELARVPDRGGRALAGFIQLIESLDDTIEHQVLSEQIDYVTRESGLIEHYKKEKGDRGEGRLENLEELVTAARAHERSDPEEGMTLLQSFLAHAALESGEQQGDAWEDCVQLMTLHSAKGLEFPLVFVVGMEEGLFPNQRTMQDPAGLEEERRLCYVGLTRAMQRLCLSYAESRFMHGTRRFGVPSRFIREIPSELVDEVRPRASYSAPVGNAPIRVRPGVAMEGSVGGFKLGQPVRHTKFGDGVVLNFEGSGDNARVQVNFSEAGSKWLVLRYANLQAA